MKREYEDLNLAGSGSVEQLTIDELVIGLIKKLDVLTVNDDCLDVREARVVILKYILFRERMYEQNKLLIQLQKALHIMAKIAEKICEPFHPDYFIKFYYLHGKTQFPGIIEIEFRSKSKRDVWLRKGTNARLTNKMVLGTTADHRIWKFTAPKSKLIFKIKRVFGFNAKVPVLHIHVY